MIEKSNLGTWESFNKVFFFSSSCLFLIILASGFEKGCVLESWGFDSNLISFLGFLIFSLLFFFVLYRYFGLGFR